MSRQQGQNPEQQTEMGEISEKPSITDVKGTECLQKEGVTSGVKCCQEIMEIKTESIYW